MIVKLEHLLGTLFFIASLPSQHIATPVEYPAGLDPRSCPNYPDCSSTISAAAPVPQYVDAQYRSIPQYQAVAPQYQSAATQYQGASPQYQQAVQSAIPATQYQQIATQYQTAPQYQDATQYQAASRYEAAPQYRAAPQYQSAAPAAAQPSYSPAVQQALDRGEYIGDGDYRGEGLQESQASELEGPQYSQPTTATRYTAQSVPITQYQSAAAAPQYQQSIARPVLPQYQRTPQVFNGVPNVSQYTAATTYGGANGGPSAYSTAAAPLAAPQQFPAGLDPRACPNYPFCHS